MASARRQPSGRVLVATAITVVVLIVLGLALVLRLTPGGTSGGPGAPAGDAAPPGWKLSPANTGLAPFGLHCDDLPEYTGSDRPAAGTVIKRQRITSPMILSAGDITISQSCVQPTTTWQGLPILATTDNNTGQVTEGKVLIEDTEFDGSHLDKQEAAFTGAFVGIADLYRNYVHDFGSGLALMDTGDRLDSVVAGNLVTGLVAYGDAGGTGNHSDAFTVRDFDTRSRPDRTLLIKGNRFDCSSGNDTGALFVQTFAGDIANLTVTQNLLEGYGYQLGLNQTNGQYRVVAAVDNRFSGTGWGAAYVQGGPGWDVWRDNYLNDPSADGNRGAVVPEP